MLRYLFRLHNDSVQTNQWHMRRDYDTIDGAKSFCKQALRDMNVSAIHVYDDTGKCVGQMSRRMVIEWDDI